ncbi:hypothetical protein HPP92_011999 [Vanilla planifolia]|uniref:Uncharacterized protein n=1 Tax=Vanilla planifolia TaxID=51239 RepID=A0A835R9J8_VANPL|nr:hypothetical protein HPP92_011999 [Vanilla planifolia]
MSTVAASVSGNFAPCTTTPLTPQAKRKSQESFGADHQRIHVFVEADHPYRFTLPSESMVNLETAAPIMSKW